MFPKVNPTLKIPKPILYLCKPSGVTVGILSEAYEIKRNIRLGAISQLSFKIPYQIERQHQLVNNPNINLLKDRYLIKFVQGNETEWFLIKTPTDCMEESVDYRSVQAYGLASELSDKLIISYNVVSKNASQVLQDALSSTIWSVGSVDADFDTMYRSFDVEKSTVLDFIFEVAKTFNALVTFDTENREVNLYNLDEYGSNKYLTVSYGKLLKSADKVHNTDDFCTRLRIYGKDDTTVNSVTITGQNYIEDYSWFIYPFERDENGNILSHSDYLSDSLCNALLDYQKLVQDNESVFQGYLTQLGNLQTTLTTQENELDDLENELAIIEDAIATANYNGQDTSSLVAQKNAKQSQIDAKNAEINTTKNSIDAVEANIDTLKNLLSIESNFTPEQITEWSMFIIEKTYENTYVNDPKQLLEIAKEEFEKLKQPKVVVNIGIVNFLECLQEHKNWDKLRLGDIVTAKNEKIGLNIQAKIMEMDFDYESGDIKLTISNVKEILSDKERFLRDLYRATTTSASVSSNIGKWNNASTDVNEVNSILNNVWSATAREIQASVDNTVSISRKGVIVSDLNDPNKILILQKGLLAISNDSGNTWKTAINSDGVFAQRLVGQIVAGVNLTITNSGGTFNVNETGVTISGTSLTITGGLPDSQIQSANAWNNAASQAANSVQLGTSYNNTVISAASGIVSTRTDMKSRTIMSGSGFAIQANIGSASSPNWENRLYADANGNLNITGTIHATSGSFTGTINATSGSFSGAVNCTSLSINGQNILNGNFISGNYIDSINANKINVGTLTGFTINSAIINGGTISGGTIIGSEIKTAPAGFDRIELTKNSAVLTLYSGNGAVFSLYNSGTKASIGFINGGFMDAGGGTVSLHGAWDFSAAFVTGLSVQAKFA